MSASLLALALCAFLLLELLAWLAPEQTGAGPDAPSTSAPALPSRRPSLRARDAPATAAAEPSGVAADHPFANTKITGRVTDAKDGRGVGGAAVAIRPAYSEPRLGPGDGSLTVSTRQDGTYHMRGIPPGSFEITASASGYLPRSMRFRKFSAVEDDDGFDFALDAASIIEGRVLDRQGAGVVGASVIAMAPGATLATRGASTTTGDEGRFVLDPVDAGPLTLLVVHPSVEPTTHDVAASEAPIRQVELRVGPGLRITGIVRDADGPIPGARVQLSTLRTAGGVIHLRRDSPMATETDSVGRFELRGLSGGQVELRADADGYQARRVAISAGSEGGDVSDVDVLLVPGAHLAGTVVGADGSPAVGALVMVSSRRGGFGRATTDEQGAFRVEGLPAEGPYMVLVRHYAHPPLEVEEATLGSGRVYRLEVSARIMGRVFDRGSQAPITEYTLELDGPLRTRSRGVSVSGAFEIASLPPGSYQLVVTAEGYGPGIREGLIVSLGRDSTGVDIGLDRVGSIIGSVRGSDEAALLVRAEITGSTSFLQGLTRDGVVLPDGTFEIRDLPAATYDLSVAHPTAKGHLSNIRVESGRATTGVDIVLSLD